MANNLSELQYLTIVCNPNQKEKIQGMLIKNGVRGINVVYGKGSINKGFLAQALGFETEAQKAVITCLTLIDNAKEILKILKDEFNFLKQNTGIAFTIPIECV